MGRGSQRRVTPRVKAGQRLQVTLWPTAQALAFRPEAMPLAIQFEDEHLLVLDRAGGLVVHPACGQLVRHLAQRHCWRITRRRRSPPCGHRRIAGQGTPAAMVVAKTLPAMTALVRAIAARRSATYLSRAGCSVCPAWAELVIEAPIRPRSACCARAHGRGGGRQAGAHRRRLPGARAQRPPGLQCTCTAGARTRSACTWPHADIPLVGDTLYGGRPGWGLQRQGLHAAQSAFTHPIDGRARLAFAAPAAADLAPRVASCVARDEAPPPVAAATMAAKARNRARPLRQRSATASVRCARCADEPPRTQGRSQRRRPSHAAAP